MECLEWQIPPIPQLVTSGYGILRPGMKHFRRSFGLYDILFVRKGFIYMEEDGVEYSVGPDHILVLEPGKTHQGYRVCDEHTEIFWLHVKHDLALRLLNTNDIPWSMALRKGTDKDIQPNRGFCYIPKFGCYSMGEAWPLLEELVELHNRLTIDSVWMLQSLFVQLLARIQQFSGSKEMVSRSGRLAADVAAFLRRHMRDENLRMERLEREFHFHQDYITRCFKRHTGMSPVEFLCHLRNEHACRLLEYSVELNVKQIAAAVGIPEANYFCRVFRKRMGMSPLAYRKRHLAAYLH